MYFFQDLTDKKDLHEEPRCYKLQDPALVGHISWREKARCTNILAFRGKLEKFLGDLGKFGEIS